MKVKCNGCGYVGEESEFPHGRDFFQFSFVAGCPKCGNRQNPGDASIRGIGGRRPFEFVREDAPAGLVEGVAHRMGEAS